MNTGVPGVALGLIALAAACAAAGEPPARKAQVQWSDGEIAEGAVTMMPGADLRIFAGNRLETLGLDAIREIRLDPVKDGMERKWRFKEAGSPEKEFWGKPYPVRGLRARLVLGDGRQIDGHLYPTALYLAGEDGATRKVVLTAKQRGEEGASLQDVVYPARIVFGGEAAAVGGPVEVRAGCGTNAATEVVALAGGALARLPAAYDRASGAWRLPSPFGAPVFLAVRTACGVAVSWPCVEPQPADRAAVSNAMPHVRDFFDSRRLLALHRDAGGDLYSLMLLSRAGPTTLGGERTQPWRLALWRWKQGEDGRLMLAGAGWFFRGLAPGGPAQDAALPRVRLSGRMWDAVRADPNAARWDVGEPAAADREGG